MPSFNSYFKKKALSLIANDLQILGCYAA